MRMPGELGRTEKVIGIIDLGSNSVRLLSLVLTLAERMDKIHRQIIRSARFGRTPGGELELCLHASEACPIEIEEIGRSQKLIKKAFHTHFTLCPCLENGTPIV